MHRPLPFRVAALGVAALVLASCFSVQTRQRPAAVAGGETTGGIALQVFADDDARQAATPGPRGLFVELDRQEGQAFVPVFRSLEPAWSVMGLAPGKYRLRFPSRLDPAGNVQPLDERARTVKVDAGKVTEVDAVLEHVDKGLIVAGVVAAVAAAILLDDWLDSHDLPTPPLPPPPPPVVLDAIFWLSLDLADLPAAPWIPAGPARPPVVTSHFPPDEALVAARRLRITFALSEPLDPGSVDPAGVAVLGESSGLLAGRTSYDAERWWIVWEAEGALPRGELFHVTLAEGAAEDTSGQDLAAPASFTFRTTL